MPSRRTKEDTWKESELLDAIQGAEKKKKSSSSRSSKSGESSKHVSRDDREREKHRRGEVDESHRKESDRKDRERRREKSERKERDVEDEHEKSRRKHRDEGGRSHKDDKERSSRRKEDRSRTENGEERSKRKERERAKDERVEHRRDKESTREKERHEGDSRDRKRERGDKDRSGSKEESGSRERHRSSKGEGKERGESKDSKERGESKDSKERGESKDSKIGLVGSSKHSKSKDKKDRHKERKREKNEFEEMVDYGERERGKDRERKHKSDKSKDDKRRSKSKHNEIEEDGSLESESSKSRLVEEGENLEDKYYGQKFRKDSTERRLTKDDSFEEEIEEEGRRKLSLSMRKTSILNTEEVNEEVIDANDYDYGDDDFEDYDDDDFEEDDGDDDNEDQELDLTNEEIQELGEIHKAIREENQLAESHNGSRSSSRPSTRDDTQGRLGISSSTPALKVQPRGKINFIAAKQKQISEKVASKTRRRGKELSKLIELDVVAMDLFELQPLNIYEVYMKSFGRTNTEQVAVQTNEDTITQEVQTDDIETETKWCQFSNEVQSFGGEDEKSQTTNTDQISTLRRDTRRLNSFLSKAVQLCITLLNEVDTNEEKIANRYAESKMKFSEGSMEVDLKSPILEGREFIDAQISPSNLVLIAYGRDKRSKGCLSLDGVICVWNLSNTSEPHMYLSCGSTPRCCCFSPRKPSYAFAGMEDGSVCVWDLREPASMHHRRKSGEKKVIVRSETFSTASIYDDGSHNSPVVSIEAIAPPEDNDSSEGSSNAAAADSGGALQLASLEENGTINIWVVIEMFSPDPGGSQQDLGLLPGGKIKLVKSGSIIPQLPKRLPVLDKKCDLVATKIHVEPSTGKFLFIGTEQGVVLHTSRFGDKVIPRSFCVNDSGTPRIVCTIDHCPWKLPYILVGCTDGSIILFSTERDYPLTVWQMFSRGARIARVQWSRNRPTVFCSLDSQSVFCVWDLLKSDASPVFKESMKKNTVGSVDFSLLSDSADKIQRVIFIYEDNTAEIHKLSKSLCSSSVDNKENMSALLAEMS